MIRKVLNELFSLICGHFVAKLTVNGLKICVSDTRAVVWSETQRKALFKGYVEAASQHSMIHT